MDFSWTAGLQEGFYLHSGLIDEFMGFLPPLEVSET